MLAPTLLDLAVTTKVWCIFDNTASGSAIQNALELNKTVAKTLETGADGQAERL
jgi:uncharacterized protein YecE (DUF72 family)